MSYQVLARKWRPRTFSEVVGQEHVVRALVHALETGRLHHAWLFTGTRGVGKTTLARILAKALNCEIGVTATPCGQCGACRDIDAGRFPDLIELDAASHTQVEKMRELLENAQYSPALGRYKVYVIDEVHMLSRNSFNAMLKTLEEPPEHVKFILATTDPQKIPVTVLSRCLQFGLKPMPPALVAKQLHRICTSEGVAAETEAIELIARAAAGSMRDALSLLDQAMAHGGGRLGGDAVRDMLGGADTGVLVDLLAAIAAGEGQTAMRLADSMTESGVSPDAALSDLAAFLHRMAIAQTVAEAVPEDLPHRERLLDLAARVEPELVQLLYQIVILGRRDLALAPDEYAGFTMTLARMLAFAPAKASTVAASGARPSETPAPAANAAPRPAAPATRNAVAAPEDARESASPANGFDGDWHGLAARLALSGMARELARNCEFSSWDGRVLELRLPEIHRAYLDNKASAERIQARVAETLGSAVKVRIVLSGSVENSPAAAEARARSERKSQAVSAIESDPFVRELIERFDGELDVGSIEPLNDKESR